MDFLWDGVTQAFALLFSGDALVFDAAWRSLWVSSLAVGSATLCGVPLGAGLALARRSCIARLVALLLRAAMSLPTVLVGLVWFSLLSRRGPLGDLDLLYTPWAIACGEFCLALPIVATLTAAAVGSLDARVRETALTLGAGPVRQAVTCVSEVRGGVALAAFVAFARCVTELGIAMLVGGNLKYRTRTLTTATTLETARGDFARGVAMSLILLGIAAAVAIGLELARRAPQESDT